jgi:dTMP kinase
MDRKLFVTFEGCEGSGKSTQSLLFYDHLKQLGIAAVHTREPGGTAIAESIRKILLDPRNWISPVTELFLYEAARAQHMHDIILPALAEGKVVVCDRFTDATEAYQGFARGLDIAVIRQLNKIATGNVVPDLTIYLDIPPARGLVKAKAIKNGGDRLDREGLSFHKKVRQGYLAAARREPQRIIVIKTAKTIEETQAAIIKTAKKMHIL